VVVEVLVVVVVGGLQALQSMYELITSFVFVGAPSEPTS